MNLTIDFTAKRANEFNNTANANLLNDEMKRGSKLTIQFKTDTTNGFPYAWVSSERLTPFKVNLNNDLINGIFNYLRIGESMDEMINADNYEVYDNGKNFQLDIFKQECENRRKPKMTPNSLDESNLYINAISKYQFGIIIYGLKKEDPKVMEYFKQQNLL